MMTMLSLQVGHCQMYVPVLSSSMHPLQKPFMHLMHMWYSATLSQQTGHLSKPLIVSSSSSVNLTKFLTYAAWASV